MSLEAGSSTEPPPRNTAQWTPQCQPPKIPSSVTSQPGSEFQPKNCKMKTWLFKLLNL